MQNHHRLVLLTLIALLLCGACVSQAKALPLIPLDDEALPFEVSLPEGWIIKQGDEDDFAHYLIQPEDYQGKETDFVVHLYFAETEAEFVEDALETSSERLELWMAEIIAEDYEIYNKNQLKIDKKQAMALDFAKPVDDTYLVGRVVISTHPTHTIAFVAMAGETEWNAKVRTFDKILTKFKIKQPAD